MIDHEARGGPATRRRGLRWALIALVLFLVAFAAARIWSASYPEESPTGSEPTTVPEQVFDGSAQRTNPYLDRGMFTWPYSPAAEAAKTVPPGRSQDILNRLAAVPTAVWLIPERYPVGQLGPFVSDIVSMARAAGEVPTFVLYGIPQRDCSGIESAGGTSEAEYLPWVSEFAEAAGPASVVVLEPDALASAVECGLVEQRERLLRSAVDILASGPATYVEAGHSNWRKPEEMAEHLRAVGVDRVRGFAVNVAGYEADADELAYAQEIVDRLGSSHFVVDSGRNGAGSNGDWCNPAGRMFGLPPASVSDGSALDARLWVKPPGESDGTCGGGPVAGSYWIERALQMAAVAGW